MGSTKVEVVMIFVSAARLGVNRDTSIGAAVQMCKEALAERAAEEGTHFTAVGVALDRDLEAGVAYLLGHRSGGGNARGPDFGPWDEIHVGHNWLNQLAVQRIWRSDPGEIGERPVSGVPQLIILERSITRGPGGYTFGEDRLVRRLIGHSAMSSCASAT